MQQSIKIVGLGLILVAGLAVAGCSDKASATAITMYKNANCGCCGAWATHMRQAGFTVQEEPREDMAAIKAKYGVADKQASCHTAIIDGYVIEGHVPASDVQRLLKQRPDIVGLAAPGMPMHSPGMQAEGLPAKGYDVLAMGKDGEVNVYAHY